MIRLTEEQKKAVSAMQRTPSFHKIIEILKEEQDFCTKGLRRAKADTFSTLQGRSQILEELLNIFQAD